MGQLVSLPTISEIHKTTDDDKFNIYKCGDLTQMLICEEPDAAPSKLPQQDTVGCPPFPHGVLPPLKNVRRKRFRVPARKSLHPDRAVDRAVRRLRELDADALHTEYEEIIDDAADTPAPADDELPLDDLMGPASGPLQPAPAGSEHASSEESDNSDAEAPAAPTWVPSPVPAPAAPAPPSERVQAAAELAAKEAEVAKLRASLAAMPNGPLKARYQMQLDGAVRQQQDLAARLASLPT